MVSARTSRQRRNAKCILLDIVAGVKGEGGVFECMRLRSEWPPMTPEQELGCDDGDRPRREIDSGSLTNWERAQTTATEHQNCFFVSLMLRDERVLRIDLAKENKYFEIVCISDREIQQLARTSV